MSAKRKGRIAQPAVTTGQHIVARESSDESTPRWCLAHLRPGWDIAGLQRDEKAAMLEHLVRRSQLKWKDIKLQDRRKLGFESIGGDSLKDNLPTIAVGQVIMCFRIGDQGRFLGIRKDETFHIIWVDCRFDLYDH